jgi:hypothetical protein
MKWKVGDGMSGVEPEWAPGRWFKIYTPDGTLWMETSDKEEAYEESEVRGWPLMQEYVRTSYEWRVVKKGKRQGQLEQEML